MKKLFLTAAFTLAGIVAVSAQTEQTKPAENPAHTPSKDQTQQPVSKTKNPSDPNRPQRNTTTVDTAASPATTMDAAKPADATKEEKKSKKKK